MMCAKSTSYSTMEAEEMLPSELQITIYQLLLKKRKVANTLSPCLLLGPPEVSRLLPWGSLGARLER